LIQEKHYRINKLEGRCIDPLSWQGLSQRGMRISVNGGLSEQFGHATRCARLISESHIAYAGRISCPRLNAGYVRPDLDESARSVSSCDVSLMKGFRRGCCNFKFAELRRAWHSPVTNTRLARQVFIYIASVIRKLHRISSTKSEISIKHDVSGV